MISQSSEKKLIVNNVYFVTTIGVGWTYRYLSYHVSHDDTVMAMSSFTSRFGQLRGPFDPLGKPFKLKE